MNGWASAWEFKQMVQLMGALRNGIWLGKPEHASWKILGLAPKSFLCIMSCQLCELLKSTSTIFSSASLVPGTTWHIVIIQYGFIEQVKKAGFWVGRDTFVFSILYLKRSSAQAPWNPGPGQGHTPFALLFPGPSTHLTSNLPFLHLPGPAPWKLSISLRKLLELPARGWQLENINFCSTCWLSGPRFFQVVQCFVVVPKVVEGHTRPIKGFEVLPFLLQDFEAILLDSFIVYQFSLEQAGYRRREKEGKMTLIHNSRLWMPLFGSFSPSGEELGVLGLYMGVHAMSYVIK